MITYSISDFPPVALLASEIAKSSVPDETKVIHEIEKLFGKSGGTNTNFLLLQSFVHLIEEDTDLDTIFHFNEQEVVQSFTTKNGFLVPVSFLQHLLRFNFDTTFSLKWGVMLAEATKRDLTVEDGYYVTAIKNSINVVTYGMYMKNVAACGPDGLIRYDAIIAYINLKNMLRSEGEKFAGYDVFCLAESFSIEQIKTLLKSGYLLEDIILYRRLGLVTVEDILEYAHSIPEEWVDAIRDDE